MIFEIEIIKSENEIEYKIEYQDYFNLSLLTLEENELILRKKIIKILINYFINYKNYNLIKYKYYYNKNDINIFEFIKMRNKIYNEILILMKLNFA